MCVKAGKEKRKGGNIRAMLSEFKKEKSSRVMRAIESRSGEPLIHHRGAWGRKSAARIEKLAVKASQKNQCATCGIEKGRQNRDSGERHRGNAKNVIILGWTTGS